MTYCVGVEAEGLLGAAVSLGVVEAAGGAPAVLSLLLELSGAAALGLAAESLLRRPLRALLEPVSLALDALGSEGADCAPGSAAAAAGSLGVAAEPAA